MTWHLEEETVRSYQTGAIGSVGAASVEAHLTSCLQCRGLLDVDQAWLASNWKGVARMVDAPRQTAVERLLRLVGVPVHLARLMAITPSLRVSWLAAVTVALAFSAVASRLASESGGFDLFLAVAPLVPVAGVAVAYGRFGDPGHEVTVASPFDPVRLLLLRTSVVTGSAVGLSLLMDLVIRSPESTGAWLLPTLALTMVTLALGTRLTMWMAASATAGGWVSLITLVTASTTEPTAAPLFTANAQLGFLVALLVAGWMLARRHDLYRRGG